VKRLVAILSLYTACVTREPSRPHGDWSQTPGASAVAAAYRDLVAALEPYACTSCHAPGDDPADVFRDPDQAMQARHRIVGVLETNAMPPAPSDGEPGISDEAARANLVALAKAFARAGDAELAREAEFRQGRIELWTTADSVTAFDDVEVTAAE
jgi:hypothetical protein